MVSTRLCKYIGSLIDNNDNYGLDVLYYCFRKAFENNNFSLNGIKDIIIGEEFHSESIQIKLSDDYDLQEKSIAILLSLRAIIIDHRLIDFCETDELIFKRSCIKPYEWVAFGSILLEFQKDDDFYLLFCMFEAAVYNGVITEELKEGFCRNTIVPPFRNLDNYYKQMANSERLNTGKVIINNAYLGDETLITLEVPLSVEYIGNTAIAYCKNLQEIIFNKPDLRFGVFPIIECPQLKTILVPSGSEEYYREQLPFYKDVIQVGTSESTIVSFKDNDEEDKRVVNREEAIEQIDKGDDVCLSEKENLDDLEFSDGLDKIKEVFKNKSTTYKFFWFLAILELMKEKNALFLSYQEILPRMVALAWQLYNSHINFGPKDSLPGIIYKLATELGIHLYTNAEKVERLMYKNYTQRRIYKILSILTKNVPYRFLSPWIKYTSDEEVKSMSQSFDIDTPYALYDDSIVLDETWYDYFINNYQELHSFARTSLIDYLKSFNCDLVLLDLMIEKE